MFKYKIILRILPTSSLLYKIKKVLSQLPILPLRYPYYLKLVYRMYVSQLFQGRFPRRISLVTTVLSNLDVLYQCIFHGSCHCLDPNHLIIIGKYFPDSFQFQVDLKKRAQYPVYQYTWKQCGCDKRTLHATETCEGKGYSLFLVRPVLYCARMTSKRLLRRLSAQKNDSL